MIFYSKRKDEITEEELTGLVLTGAERILNYINPAPRKILLLPPDITRAHSGAGYITEVLYNFFSKIAEVFVMPALGQHCPHTPEQNKWMFGSIPEYKIIIHDWLHDCIHLGHVPAGYVTKITEGKADWKIPIAVNRLLFEEKWDIIINIGHVVPHEVLGFASHNKNYFIGLGSKESIGASHIMAASYGIDNNLGNLMTPLRACFNKAEQKFLKSLPDAYMLVTMRYNGKRLVHSGFYCGDDTDTYLHAAKQSASENITYVGPLKKIVAVMQGNEFYSTWVANKAVYRTRKALADGGELIIIAPGLKRFGEQMEVDNIIKKYGYRGTEQIIDLWKKNDDLKEFAHATAHLLHGSADGRFTITYAPGHLTKDEIEQVNYNYLDYQTAIEIYNPENKENGFNILKNGEEIYFINTPSAGLWVNHK